MDDIGDVNKVEEVVVGADLESCLPRVEDFEKAGADLTVAGTEGERRGLWWWWGE